MKNLIKIAAVIVMVVMCQSIANGAEIDPKDALIKPVVPVVENVVIDEEPKLNFFGDKSTWDTADTILQTATGVLFLVDTLQTMSFPNNTKTNCSTTNGHTSCTTTTFKEGNVILGEHPSNLVIGGYMLGTFLTHTAVAYYVPDMIFSDPIKASILRKAIISGALGIEIWATTHNYSAGVRIKF